MEEKLIQEIVNKISSSLDKGFSINLESAQRLAKAVRLKAASIGVKSVVAIYSKHANPILVEVSDDALIASYDIAVNKAFTAASVKMSTKELAKLASPGGSLYGIQFTNNNKIVVFGGGELLFDKQSNIVGSIGVSGGSEPQDDMLAKYGKEIFEKGEF